MKNIFPKIAGPGIRNACLLLLLLCFLFPAVLSAQKKKKPKWRLEASLNSFYDDNILKYSDKYLDRFMNQEDEGRFHIDTYDDMIINPSLGLSCEMRIFDKQKSVFDADVSYSKYLNNDIKSWGSFSVGYRQYLNRKLNFKVFYSYIPEFYVRHFRDDDWVEFYGYTPETFTPYVFSKDNYGFWAENTFFKNTRLRFYFYYMKYFHNENYTEYDSDNLMYRIKLYQPLHKNFNLEASYQFTTSEARGYDEPGGSKELSDAPDADYDEDGFILGLTWKMPRIKKRYHSLKLETLVYKRYYQTDQPVEIDKLHAGRVDDNLRFYLTYYLSLTRDFKVSAFYKWYYRDSGTTSELNDEYVSDEKDYRQNQVGLKLTYRFDF